MQEASSPSPSSPAMCSWTLTPQIPENFEKPAPSNLFMSAKHYECTRNALPKGYTLEIPSSRIRQKNGATYLVAAARKVLFDKSIRKVYDLAGAAYLSTNSSSIPFGYVYAPDFQPGWTNYKNDVQQKRHYLLFSTEVLTDECARKLVQELVHKRSSDVKLAEKQREGASESVVKQGKRKGEQQPDDPHGTPLSLPIKKRILQLL